MTLPNDLIDSLLSNYKKPEDLIGENGLLKQLTKVLVERALQVAADLKRVYSAATEAEAEQYLTEFEANWDDTYPPIAQSWRNH